MYCTVNDVYGAAGISSAEVSEAIVENNILGAQSEVDRVTNTTYWLENDDGTATSATNNTITNSGESWSGNAYAGNHIWITGGTGINQIRKIVSNTKDTITVSADWTTNPDATSTYRICYSAQNPYVSEELRDGDDYSSIFLNKYPLVLLESVESNSTTVTPSTIYQYKEMGKLLLSSESEVQTWTSYKAQQNVFAYYWGVYPIPYEVVRYTIVIAAMRTLGTQTGGTFNVPSTYSLPEASLSIGQAYVNIRETFNMLKAEKEMLEATLIKYTSFA